MKSANFKRKADANNFAKEVHGFVEGPFIDDNLDYTYTVFYKEEVV